MAASSSIRFGIAESSREVFAAAFLVAFLATEPALLDFFDAACGLADFLLEAVGFFFAPVALARFFEEFAFPI